MRTGANKMIWGILMVIWSGCTSMLEQQWSQNLAQAATAITPAMIDGDLQTQSLLPLKVTDLHKLSGYPSAETVIQLASVQDIHRIVVHSDDLNDFQLWIFDHQEEEWRVITQVKHRPPTSVVEVKARTTQIKLKVNPIAVLGARPVVEKALKNEPIQGGQSGAKTAGTLVDRLKKLGQSVADLNQIQPKLPSIREIEIYGLKQSQPDVPAQLPCVPTD